MEMTKELVQWAQGDKYKYCHSFELEICHSHGIQEIQEFNIIVLGVNVFGL